MRHGTGTRIFAVYAGASLLAVVALGLVLGTAIIRESDDRALDEAASRARTIADSGVAPILAGADLTRGVPTQQQRDRLVELAALLRRDSSVLRTRVRAPGGGIAFDPEHPDRPFEAVEDDEVTEAASGEPVKVLTRVGADAVDGASTSGQQAVETYVPIKDPVTGDVNGVLEVYLPYAPFRDAAAASSRRVGLLLAVGLLGLWGVLAAISWSVTRRLRRSAADNDWLARHDGLTRLPNRVGFAEELASRSGSPLTVSMVDLARFREINDTLGQANADSFLVQVSEAVRDALPPGASMARLGGDQFGIASTGEDEAAADVLHRAVASAAAVAVPVGGIKVSAEVAIGWATASDAGRGDGTDGADGVVRAAELALHVAKETASSPVRYSPEHDHFDPERLALAAELSGAIAGGQLVLHYQPKLDLRTGSVDAVEALVRWQHPDRGLLAPVAFIPIAESTSLMAPLTDWVVGEVVRQVGEWSRQGIDLSVSVNVSARSLADPGFADHLLGLLAGSGVDAGRIVVEITETAIIADPARAGELLRRLHDAGLRISLDDFGQGATSLVSLAALPLDEIKVDRAFVVGMDRSEAQRAVVEFIVSLGHRLGLTVVAEGIETEDAAAALVDFGCDEGQGFLFSRPVPGPQVADWVAHHRSVIRARVASLAPVPNT
jgi:diguanylate cyclase